MTDAQRTLILVRHAKSAWPEGVADVERPLAGRGRRDAPAAGRWLREHVGEIDLALCSRALRTRQTWDLLEGELRFPPRVRHDERLYAATAETLLTVTAELSNRIRTVMLIGHNPGLEDLVTLVTGVPHQLKTSAVAVLAGSSPWTDIGPRWARLETLATPRGQ